MLMKDWELRNCSLKKMERKERKKKKEENGRRRDLFSKCKWLRGVVPFTVE